MTKLSKFAYFNQELLVFLLTLRKFSLFSGPEGKTPIPGICRKPCASDQERRSAQLVLPAVPGEQTCVYG